MKIRYVTETKKSRQLFRLWLGVTEYLFRKPKLLEEVIDIAIHDNSFRSDDLEFTFAARVSPHTLFQGFPLQLGDFSNIYQNQKN